MNAFNFFTMHLQDYRKKHIKKIIFYMMMMIFIIIFLIVPFLNFSYMKKIRHQIQHVDKEISKLSYEEIKMIQKKKENINKLKLRIDEFNDFKLYIKNKDMVNDCLLYTLKNMVPNNLFFQTIEMNSKEIKIKGFATTQISIAQFEHNLEATNCFEEIFISNIENRGNYDFTLVFSIKEF